MSAMTGAAGLPLPAEDGWAILAKPPGARDLVYLDHWEASLERSRRRRAARRRPPIVARGHARLSIALAAVALGGPAASIATASQGAAATAPASDLDLGVGDSGPAVSALQRALGVAPDGHFGPHTRAAVRAYQRAHGIPATGHVGPLTTAALGLHGAARSVARTAPSSAATPAATTLSRSAARAMQRALGVSADGVVGPKTRAALRAFEQAHGLPADGIPDPDSLQALGVDAAAADDTADQSASADGAGGSTTASPAAGVQAAVAAALTKVGAPYASGATGPSAFDCSGLVSWAMRQAGISVPRTSYAQFGLGTHVSQSQIQAGDLVFFDTAGSGASDVGIATSATTAVSATTHGVMTHSILSGYWGQHYVGARRIA
jgi:cell wall-associated NlpC family hydrolase